MSRPLRVLSLFDSTGTWASFAPPGAEVYAVDMQPRPLEWSRARGVVHVQARIKPDPLDGEEIRFEPGDLTVRDAVKRWPRPDVVLMAPPCQALSNLRHVRTVNGGKATPGRESMTTDEGWRWSAGASSMRRPFSRACGVWRIPLARSPGRSLSGGRCCSGAGSATPPRSPPAWLAISRPSHPRFHCQRSIRLAAFCPTVSRAGPARFVRALAASRRCPPISAHAPRRTSRGRGGPPNFHD